jgi:hypothetical protein
MGPKFNLTGTVILAVASAWLLAAPAAEANCRWRVSASIEGVLPGVPPLPGRVWPVQNMEVRVQARTQGGLWNTANWPATTTDSNGQFSVTTAVVFPDPVCQQNRQFRVQIRGFDTGYNWRTVHTGSAPGPNEMSGILTPAPTHAVTIGNIICDDETCRGGIIRVTGLTEPPVDLQPGSHDDNDDADDGHDDEPRGNPRFEEAPCGLRQAPFVEGVEFRFGQMPSNPGPLSPDQALRIETRPRGNGDMTLNRVIQHIRVENAGSRDYRHNRHCPAEVHFRLNEGPGRRGDGENAWSAPYTADIPDIAANASEPVNVDSNLWGAGDDLVGEWDEDWEYALVDVTLDATFAVMESAEGDNRIVHCYHAPSNSFAAMSACEAAAD